jgi:RNA polymerase sigma factor (sigma-70 family)
LIAGLTRVVRDVGIAEELAQDALVAALETWPTSGVPQNPGAWLMTTAKRRAIDLVRHRKNVAPKHEAIARELDEQNVTPDLEGQIDDVGDDLLRLVFVACHPVLTREAQVALTLRLLGGLTTEEIARAFLTPEPTIAQRIVRAKKTLTDANVPFELPAPSERAERTSAVLEVIYLVFNEGYAATAGDDWMRPELCQDAMRLGRILAGLLPREAEVHGLVALMELTASRMAARLDAQGAPVLLLAQDRSRWDRLLIQRGLDALALAETLDRPGPYVLQAAIAACHARAHVASDTDWVRIAALYEVLGRVTPSPVVELNRAVAVSMAFGPEVALPIVDALAEAPAMRGYHLLPSVRADLLERLGRHHEARAELERAAALARNAREKAMLLARIAGGGVEGSSES